jgi:hypothetical protein
VINPGKTIATLSCSSPSSAAVVGSAACPQAVKRIAVMSSNPNTNRDFFMSHFSSIVSKFLIVLLRFVALLSSYSG